MNREKIIKELENFDFNYNWSERALELIENWEIIIKFLYKEDDDEDVIIENAFVKLEELLFNNSLSLKELLNKFKIKFNKDIISLHEDWDIEYFDNKRFLYVNIKNL